MRQEFLGTTDRLCRQSLQDVLQTVAALARHEVDDLFGRDGKSGIRSHRVVICRGLVRARRRDQWVSGVEDGVVLDLVV